MARFTGIPALPEANVDEWQSVIIGALKQNVELLTGTRGESDGASRALLRSDVTVPTIGQPRLVALSARGTGLRISGANVPALVDYVNLIRDVQALAADVADLRNTLNTLISQTRG